MKRILSQGLLAIHILAYCSSTFAGLGERRWEFAPGESVTIKKPPKDSDFSDGAEYGCNEFDPKEVSFTLTYFSLSDLNRLQIVADDNDKITHDKKNKVFTIKKVKSLGLRFPWWGNYIFTNTTNEKIVGIDCDAGHY